MKGALQLSLYNFGMKCQIQEGSLRNEEGDVRRWNTIENSQKKKVVSTKPLEIPVKLYGAKAGQD